MYLVQEVGGEGTDGVLDEIFRWSCLVLWTPYSVTEPSCSWPLIAAPEKHFTYVKGLGHSISTHTTYKDNFIRYLAIFMNC